jgi:very-short-patch-repair endonuclease/predicted transcriptional regulator of viral defense system
MQSKAQSLSIEDRDTAVQRRPGLIQRERRLATLAARQHGVVAKRQLRALGVGEGAVKHRLRLGRLRTIHRGVYAIGQGPISMRGRWLAAVLACGDGALLSHRSAAALWGLTGIHRGPVDVTSPCGRSSRTGIALHRCEIAEGDRAINGDIPVTSVPRTLVDLATALDRTRLNRAFEEADRLRLLDMRAMAQACERAKGRRGIGNLRSLIEQARAPSYTRSPLENRFLEFYRRHLADLPPPHTNVSILGQEADACWPRHRLVVEMDSWEFHGHRAAFERDRARDAALQAAGYRVIRLTHRRLESEGPAVAAELRKLLAGPR